MTKFWERKREWEREKEKNLAIVQRWSIGLVFQEFGTRVKKKTRRRRRRNFIPRKFMQRGKKYWKYRLFLFLIQKFNLFKAKSMALNFIICHERSNSIIRHIVAYHGVGLIIYSWWTTEDIHTLMSTITLVRNFASCLQRKYNNRGEWTKSESHSFGPEILIVDIADNPANFGIPRHDSEVRVFDSTWPGIISHPDWRIVN